MCGVVVCRPHCAGDARGQDARDGLGGDAGQHQRAGGARVVPAVAARPGEAPEPRLGECCDAQTPFVNDTVRSFMSYEVIKSANTFAEFDYGHFSRSQRARRAAARAWTRVLPLPVSAHRKCAQREPLPVIVSPTLRRTVQQMRRPSTTLRVLLYYFLISLRVVLNQFTVLGTKTVLA